MASKHLYELDDLGASLLYALRTHDTVCAVQVAKEIKISDEEDLLFRLLTLAWLLSPPGNPMETNCAVAFDTKNTDAFLFAMLSAAFPVYDLPELPEHVEIPVPRPSKNHPPAAWNYLPKAYTPEQAHTLWRAVNYALEHKFHEHAAYLVNSLIPTNPLAASSLLKAVGVQKSLTTMLEVTVYSPLTQRIVEHALAARVLDMSEVVEDKQLVQLWRVKSPVGRKGRTFTIPSLALTEWHVRPKQLKRLENIPFHILDEEASNYWKEAVHKYGIKIVDERFQFINDVHMEQFYSTYFPDDIPDEWTEEERKKSHGLIVPFDDKKNHWQTAFILCWS